MKHHLFYKLEQTRKHMASVELLKHEFANINEIKMHYVTIGDGPLIVFLHGIPEFWNSWRYQIPFFSKGFKVVVPDMRGCGETERPTEVGQ